MSEGTKGGSANIETTHIVFLQHIVTKGPSAFVQEQGKSKTMSSSQFDQFSTAATLQGSDRLNSS